MRLILPAFFLFFQLAALRAQTFSSTVNDSIPDDGSTVFYEITVGGLPGVIDTIFGLEQVCVNINHTYVEDMTVKLEAPNGQTIVLFAGVGGGGHDFVNTCVAGEGLSFSIHAAPFTGVFQSRGVLGNFNRGQDPNGVWKLVIHDTYPGADAGFLIDFAITFGPNPAKPFVFLSSDLPIVKLTTLAAPIDNEPKVPVLMQIIDNGAGIRNFADQTNFAYEGNIMAEWQGFTGPYYPKKNYDFEVVDDLGNAMDTSILGMPRESDWIFKAEFLDQTLMKNTVAYEMARRMGRYATRTAPCEIMLDGEYIGVYMLTEKIKRDKNRVDIAKLTAADTSGSDLTGGYIFEMNINNNSPADWISDYLPINSATSPHFVEFKFDYPKSSKIEPQQAEYLKNFTADFEDVLHGPNFLDTASGYRKWADAATFVDFLIVNEIGMNYDSYGRSTHLVKEKDTDGGLLKMGPPWDFDRAFDYTQPGQLNLWVWQETHHLWPFPFWWSRMWEDVSFRQQVACRWQTLRQKTLSNDAFSGLIDSLGVRLDESQQRNFRVWNDLGALTYPQHLEMLKSHLASRLFWMDSVLATEPIPVATFSGGQNGPNDGLWAFSPTDSTAQNYTWDFGDGTVSTLQNPVHQYVTGGNYTVRLTIGYGYGCSASSEKAINFQYLDAPENFEQQQVEVSPNPFSDRIFLKNTPQNAVFEMTNAIGQLVFLGKNIGQTDFSKLPAGVYFLKISAKTTATFKLVKA